MQNGDAKPPVDLRYLKRAESGADHTRECVSKVISFLETIYSSVAENLPDVRDDTWDEGPPEDPHGMSIGLEPGPDCRETGKGQEAPTCRESLSWAKCCRWHGRTLSSSWDHERILDPVQHQSQSEQQASFLTFWRVPFNELTFMSGFRFRTGALEDVAK